MKSIIFFVCIFIPLLTLANNLTQAHELWSESNKTIKILPHLPVSKLTNEQKTVTVNGYTSYQVNTSSNGQNILMDAANEPSIAVNPLNPKQIVIGWRQFNNTSSDFREAGLAYSHDGGLTWKNNGPLDPGQFRSDPVLAANADGVFYYQSLAVLNDNGQPGLQDDDTFRVDQWRSIDGGKTWIDKTNAIGGDKSWFAIDESDNNTRGNIYAVWNLAGNNHYPRSFNYSVDNGMSYSAPVSVPKSPVYGTVAIGFDGEVYMAGLYGDGTNYGDINLIKTNNPMSQMFPDFVQVTPLDLGGPLITGRINPEGLLGQIWITADKSNRHTRGNIYVFSSVDHFTSDPLDVNFIRSRDDGLSFSQPKRINDDTSLADWQWFGTMGLAPNGRIDLIWLDTRNALATPSGKKFSQLHYSYSYDGGISFSKNQAMGPIFNHSLGYPVQRKMGDYIDIVSDNLGAHIAYTATYTGGQDIYYIYAKPAAFAENPYFPSHEMDGLWHNPAVPRQGILSKTLVPDTTSDSPQLINFEAVFTEAPNGQPTWFVLQNAHPSESDSIKFTVLYPTGDLTAEGTPLRPIGMATKSRLYDDQGELIKNSIQYNFDMSDEAIEQVALMSDADIFDLDFYQNSAFYQTQKTTVLNPLVPPEQDRNIHCLQQNLVFENPTEVAEGRVPVTYKINDTNSLFIADFTYQKTTLDNGVQQTDLNEFGLAQPTWQVTNLKSGELQIDTAIINNVYRPNGGNGFFNENTVDPGVELIGTETITFKTGFQVNRQSSDGSEENYNAVAFNSFCGANNNKN